MDVERTQTEVCEVSLNWMDQLVQHEAKGSPEAIKSVWDALIAANRTYQYPRFTRIRGHTDPGDGDGLGLEDVRRLTLHDGDGGTGDGSVKSAS